MVHSFYSLRTNINPRAKGLSFEQLKKVFFRAYVQMEEEGFFVEWLGFHCSELDYLCGLYEDIDYYLLTALRKEEIWPIGKYIDYYKEDDLFDIIEFLFQSVSKPLSGKYHSGCGYHWETFDRVEGRKLFREKINSILLLYETPYELNDNGYILAKPEKGLERLINADIPDSFSGILARVDSAKNQYLRHGASIDNRRHAVKDLVDILELLRPKLKEAITQKDEKDLFNIANNFGIRHHNEMQKTDYDQSLWLSWMFYFYLATIHYVIRKLEYSDKV